MKTYTQNVFCAFSQFLNALTKGNPNELLSARSYRTNNKVMMLIINGLFFDKHHCKTAFEFERDNRQLPFDEYKDI